MACPGRPRRKQREVAVGGAEERPALAEERPVEVGVDAADRHYACARSVAYGGRATITRGELHRSKIGQPPQPGDDDVVLSRQALHARRIKLAHPATGDPIEFTAPLPADIEAVLNELRTSRK